jgi:hypothetical protein
VGGDNAGGGGEGGGGLGGAGDDGSGQDPPPPSPDGDDQADPFMTHVRDLVNRTGIAWRRELGKRRGLQIYQIKTLSTDAVKTERRSLCAVSMIRILRAALARSVHLAGFTAHTGSEEEARAFVLPIMDRQGVFEIIPGFFETDNAASPIFAHYAEKVEYYLCTAYCMLNTLMMLHASVSVLLKVFTFKDRGGCLPVEPQTGVSMPWAVEWAVRVALVEVTKLTHQQLPFSKLLTTPGTKMLVLEMSSTVEGFSYHHAIAVTVF